MRKRAYVAPVGAIVVLLAVDAGCAPPANPWTVVSVRERRAGEVPFEEASRYLWPSPDANNVPGPDSLVARVRSDEKLHSYIELEDLRTGKTTLLLKANAFRPHWSPDGKYISCEVWKSPGQRSELTVIDVANRSIIVDPEIRVSAAKMKWSPDSRTLVADGVIYGRPRTMLYVVSVPEGAVMALDTLPVLGDYEFSWSPDGHWIVFSRATKLDRHGEYPIAADLWIADAESGEKWPLLETTDWVESNPLWVTNRSIRIVRARWDGNRLGIEEIAVMDLSRSRERQD